MSLEDFYANKNETLDLAPLQPLWKPEEDKKAAIKGGKLTLDEDQFMEWFKLTRPQLERFSQGAFEDAWANLFWYTGDYLPRIPLVIRTDSGAQLKIPRQLAPLAVNYINYLTNKRVAELSIYKPIHDTKPADEESDTDRMTSRVVKRLIERTKMRNELDEFFNLTEKDNMVHGFVYASVDWNPRRGDKKKKTDKNGVPIREGETEIQLRHAWHVLPWRARSWNKVPLIIEIEDILHIEEARVRFGDRSLEPYDSSNLYTFSSPFIEKMAPDEVPIFRTVYKPDQFLPYGAVVRSTHERVLEMEVNHYPWSHEDFPVERYTDIEVPSRFHPMSFYQNVKPMQHTYNNLSGLLKRYIFTLGHPKIMHERGSVNVKSLGNSPSLIGVKASARFQPSIMQVKSIGPDPFNFRATLKDEMISFSSTHKIGTGELPPNTRSGVMISRLREIENQERGPQIDKRNSFMGRVLLKAASVDGDHVPLTSKENIARIVGKEMVQDVISLKDVKVASQTKVLITNSTGFSAEMTGRISEISAIEKECGLPMSPNEKRDIIGGVLREKHYDVLSAAKYTAQAEVEMLNDGKTPTPPRPTDDLCMHWTVLCIDMQSMNHRRLPEKIQKRKEQRLLEIECLIEEILQKNPQGSFAAKVAALDGYPRLYNMTSEPSAPSAGSDGTAAPDAGQAPGSGAAGAQPDMAQAQAAQAAAQAQALIPSEPI